MKVADFGLLKDLHETHASMMGGLTPLYSPPEVFDALPALTIDGVKSRLGILGRSSAVLPLERSSIRRSLPRTRGSKGP